MPRIKITGLPKAQVGIQNPSSGFIQPVTPPQLFTPPKILQDYQEPDIQAPINENSLINNKIIDVLKRQQEDAYRKQYPNAPKEFTGTTSTSFTPSGSEAVNQWSNRYATDKGFATSADVSVANNAILNRPRREAKSNIKFINKKYGTNYKTPLFGSKATNFITKAGDIADTISSGIGMLSAAAGLKDLNDSFKQDRRNRAQLLQESNYAVDRSDDKGMYLTNTGDFQPRKKSVNPGMYANKYYASNNFVGRYGGVYADGGSFESVIPQKIISTSSYDTPIISPVESSLSLPSASSSYIPETNIGPVNNAVEVLSSVQAKLESGYDPTKPPTAKENLKAWNVPASKTIYGKYQVSEAERKEAYKNLPELKNTFPTFQDYNNAFLGKVNPDIQQQVQEITYKKFLAPRNLQLAGGDIYAAALYHYLPAAAKLYTQGKLDLSLKPGQLFPNNKTLVAADDINPTFGSYLDRFKKEYVRQKKNNVFEIGGQNNNTMKIKIVETPDEIQEMAGGGQPKYSGQSDYGLYIGQRNLYSSMPENPYKVPGNSVTEEEETPDNPYVLEAEGGETILRPDGTHMNITGKRHSEGGERLTEEQAPEGSFIYSDTAKMKLGGKVLENFGKSGSSKKKYTPAELAKQYNVNKYRAILQDVNADKLQKDTASRMIENYERKLAELALVQEGKKGFPQGIPDVAQKLLNKLQGEEGSAPTQNSKSNIGNAKFGGGLEKYQVAGQYPSIPGGRTFNVDGKQILAGLLTEAQKNKLKQISSYPGGFDLYYAPGAPGTKVSQSSSAKKATPGGKFTEADARALDKMMQAGVSPEELAKKGYQSLNWLKSRGTYVPKVVETQEKPEEWAYTQEEEKVPGKTNMTYTEKEKEKDKIPDEGPKVPPFTPPSSVAPFKAGRPPFFSYEMFVAPEREQTFAGTRRNVIPNVMFYDPTRELAQSAALAKGMTEGYQGSVQGYGANAMAAQMQAAENAANILSKYNNLNVGVGNEAERQRAALLNEETAYNVNRADIDFHNKQQTRKAARNLLAKYLGNLGILDRAKYDTLTKTNMLNATSPYFNIGYGRKSANLQFKPGVDAYSMITGKSAFPGQQQASSMTGQQYLEKIKKLKELYPNLTPSQISAAIKMDNPQLAGGRAGMSALASQMMGANPYAATNPMYNQGYDVADLYDQWPG